MDGGGINSTTHSHPQLTHHYTAYNDVDHDPCVKIVNSACQLKLGPRQLGTIHHSILQRRSRRIVICEQN